MNSVVMIAYQFPPEGNAGTFRPLRFVRHLPALGWQPSVISVDTDSYERYDPDLLNLVPKETEVIRVRNPDPWLAFQAKRERRIEATFSQSSPETISRMRASQYSPLRSVVRNIVRKAESWCYHPDMAMCWIRPAAEAAVRLCARKPAKVIWTTVPPYSSFIVAKRVSDRTKLPYVLDFRTSWTIVEDDLTAQRPAWARFRDRNILSQLFKKARAAIFAYQAEAECFWRVYRGALDPAKIHIIPNGYEGTLEQFSMPDGEKFTLLYTGTLSQYRYDTLLRALDALKQSDPVLGGKLKVLFVGDSLDELSADVKKLGLTDVVETRAPVSQAEVTRLQRRAHALLMLERVPTMKGYELLAGAKLFGYLRAGRPILGVLPRGEARKVLERVRVPTIADVDSPEQIIAAIRKLTTAWSGGCLSSLLPDPAACEVYSAEHQTKALVCALEGAPPMEAFVPGACEVPPSLAEDIARWAHGTVNSEQLAVSSSPNTVSSSPNTVSSER
jgi:glycosyltransferase involved in cell wall biosynthesis